MGETNKHLISQLTDMVDQLLSGNGQPLALMKPPNPSGDPEIDALADKIWTLNEQYRQFRTFILDLAAGKLNTYPPRGNSFAAPYKQLHSDLKHLTWQIQQIADGDYSQQVTFSGDFALAINKMILDLRERRTLSDLLRESNQTKDKLFSIIAHDLKNPFNTMVGMSNLLIDEVEAGRMENIPELAKAIQEAGSSGYALLINLLEWSRLQSNRIIVSLAPVNLRTIILGNIHYLTPTAKAKEIAIRYADVDEYPLTSDSNILNTILRNLISNAIKFSYPASKIEVCVNGTPETYRVSVRDHGVGIPEETMSKLFRIDAQKSTRGTSYEEGTGLGLVLCKELIEKIDGEIEVESTCGKGSTFTISIPIN